MYKELNPSLRTIMTPGPVEVEPRVLRAMSTPILGQFDPEFTAMMNETMEMLRRLFQTDTSGAFLWTGRRGPGLKRCCAASLSRKSGCLSRSTAALAICSPKSQSAAGQK